MESRDADREQHPGVSVGLIRVQQSLLAPVPNPTSAQGSPGLQLVTLRGTGTSAPRRHSCFWIPPGMLCSAPESIQSCGASTEPGSAQSRTALNPSSCLTHPSKGSRDQDKPRKVTLDEAARVAAEVEPLKAAEIQNSCNTSNTSHPLWHSPQPDPGLQARKGELRKCFLNVGKCCQCFIRDRHSKIPPTRISPVVAASPGDASSHDQNGIFRGQVRTRRGD